MKTMTRINKYILLITSGICDKDGGSATALDFEQEWMSKPVQDGFKNLFVKLKVKTKRGRDPKAPVKGLTSYFHFCVSEGPKIKAESPGIPTTHVTKELGKRWRNLDIEVKQHFIDLGKSESDRYINEKREYVPSDGYDANGNEIIEDEVNVKLEADKLIKKEQKAKLIAIKKNTVKNVDLPKKNFSAFSKFATDNRHTIKQANDGVKSKGIARLLAETWKSLDKNSDVVTSYKRMAAVDMDRYKKEMTLFENTREEKQQMSIPPEPEKSTFTTSKPVVTFEMVGDEDFEDFEEFEIDGDKEVDLSESTYGIRAMQQCYASMHP
jgi:hypothetical protein